MTTNYPLWLAEWANMYDGNPRYLTWLRHPRIQPELPL